MEFAQSPRSTLGIEWELQYIDADSHALRQCADSVMTALRALDTDTSSIHREMLLNTVEFVSEPHEHVRDCVEDMARSTSVLEPVIHPMRVRLGTAGTHPFSNPASQIVTDSERYAELVNRTQYWGRQMLLFGTHVHVGVDNRAKVWPLIRALLTRAYHIQALTSASPIWNSEVTGYASNRAMVFQQLPTAGIPYQFLTWEDFEKYVAGMVATGVIEQVNEVRWDIRPSPANGTIELRMCDAATNRAELGMVAALAQCLVEYFSRMLDAGEELPTLPDWFVRENKWRASRYGMDAILISDAGAREELVAHVLVRMVDKLAPIAAELGCSLELEWVERIMAIGAPYQRQMEVFRSTGGDFREVVRYMLAEFDAGHPIETEDFLL
ncbi:carboxylate-amine ligase [Arcanobacterium wilhelmae]|uniref:Putative glutamate--cysteine ligase 2 n=1 Tax=Arcanobacterium wilhelmae TaxID=1803177 RepID=A0ABT9N8D8_9ACTO|nr:glutamate--cysteine ligase [Arcanobacterium wilhelmae]MDP9799963.1 carboxylate-amine ligase [Arcanobacterium wilhelmae]WFN91096.1 glutamate--cysteine ligase [Arcanobacterium wilhelmae]